MKVSVSVRQLAEFVHRRGDLFARLDGRARPEEGIATQRKLQRQRGATYERERSVAGSFTIGAFELNLSGRVDGCDLAGAHGVVEEFKTSRADPELLHAHAGSAHWAQARLYAALLLDDATAVEVWQIRLLYCHPDTLACAVFEQTTSRAELQAFLGQTLQWYAGWLTERSHARAQRDRVLESLAFPYAHYRPHQLAMARRVYRTLREGEGLLLEAPTGSGKTMALLYPAVRALREDRFDKHLYLTSRSTGARAALAACADLDPSGDYLSYVQIIAKEQACLVEGMPCDPERCPYAAGYYDKVRDAVRALLAERRCDPDATRRVAESHQVCPFELSLDTALWADLVVGDYNYVFDPVVKLQRFAGRGDIGLLIDESHQLAERAQSMLSLALRRSAVKAALKERPPESLAKGLRRIDRVLGKLKAQLQVQVEQDQEQEQVLAPPEALLRALQNFNQALTMADIALEAMPAVRELVFAASRWVRSETWVAADRFIYTARCAGRDLEVRLVCLDPGPYLAEVLAGFAGHVRFSGTVTPLALYQTLHGQSGAAERVGSPFSDDQLMVMVVPDVPVYWRSRARSLPRLVQLVAAICAARRGTYLVALPSFDYLNQFVAAYRQQYPNGDLVAQTPGMAAAERTEFLERLSDRQAPVVAAVVLGGVFGESVDFADAPLAGVVCVGIGLPPPSLAREQMAALFDARRGASRASSDATTDSEAGAAVAAGVAYSGHEVAYLQPAMTRILQMAGRLLRSPDDRGVLCLVDGRYQDAAIQDFFPAHWRPQRVRAAAVSGELQKFWHGDGAQPRLPRTFSTRPAIELE